MEIKLIRAELSDAERLWKMQVEAFAEMYSKYRDSETSPAAEPLEKTAARLRQPFTYFYFIHADGEIAGAIRVIDSGKPGKPKRISPVFVMPALRNRGIAQAAIREAERLHGGSGWELDTVLQEAGNCHLYEKLGYRQTGETREINENMTIVYYKKD